MKTREPYMSSQIITAGYELQKKFGLQYDITVFEITRGNVICGSSVRTHFTGRVCEAALFGEVSCTANRTNIVEVRDDVSML